MSKQKYIIESSRDFALMVLGKCSKGKPKSISESFEPAYEGDVEVRSLAYVESAGIRIHYK